MYSIDLCIAAVLLFQGTVGGVAFQYNCQLFLKVEETCLTDYLIVVGHLVVDESESIVARPPRVGSY